MNEKSNDTVYRLAGVVGLALLLAFAVWQNTRPKQSVKVPGEETSGHDHGDPIQHGNETAPEKLDADSATVKLSGIKEGDVRVVAYEAYRFAFDPDPLVVLAGERVRLQLKSRDVKHGMMIPEIDFSAVMSAKKVTDAEFTAPAAPGKYPVFCSVFCGADHGSMKGSLVVLPQPEEGDHESDSSHE